MAFVKLDTGILHSTLWFARDCRELFITALLMAEPREITESTPQLKVTAIEPTGFTVPPGWYGFVRAAGIGIIRQAGMARDQGLKALVELGDPDTESRSAEFEGRRLVRVDGGYIVLNYIKYRERDTTARDRQRRWRQRQKEMQPSQSDNITSRRDITLNETPRNQVEVEVEVEVDLKSKSKAKERFAPPSLAEVEAHLKQRKSSVNAQTFVNFYESKGWRVGNQPMRDWKAAVVTWEQREGNASTGTGPCKRHPGSPLTPRGRCWDCYAEENGSS